MYQREQNKAQAQYEMEIQKLMGSSDVDRTFVLAQNNMFSQESTPYNKSVISSEKDLKVSKTAQKINPKISVSSSSYLKCNEDFGKFSGVQIEKFSPSSSESTESLHKNESGEGNAREYLEDELVCGETLSKSK